jgi:hypothetical protein
MVSMSTGELRIEGARAVYDLRLPLYEVQHMKDPERELFDHLRFLDARQVSRRCGVDASENAFRCAAEYEFAAVPDTLSVECTFYRVTVPNHVHLLRAVKDGKTDQAVFDMTFTKAEIRFRPPTAFESAVSQFTAGLLRAAGGAAQILFLAALALAARSRRELIALAAAFLAGEILTALVVPATTWRPATRFIEAALALTIAYLAVEMLALPQAGRRWMVAAVLGLFHGLYFAAFLTTSEYSPVWVLAGAVAAEAALIAALAFVLARLARFAAALRPVRVAASLLLVTGMVWFFLRLRG